MAKQTNLLDTALRFDPNAEIERICDFIHNEVQRRGAHGIVLGLSGGLDSTTCAYLCSRCLPAEQIHLYSLPERDSSSLPHNHAMTVTRTLGLPLVIKDLSEMFRKSGLYDQVSFSMANNRSLLEQWIKLLRLLSGSPSYYPWAQQYAFGKRQGFLGWILRNFLWKKAATTKRFVFEKVRTRMLVLSTQSIQLDCLLVCTTDRSEWTVGFYDMHGDGVGDIAPLRHLYKTQIREVAKALGVPDEIIQKPSSGDLAAGLPNETAMGVRYEQLDCILMGMSLGMDDIGIASKTGVSQSLVRAIRSASNLADERRSMPLGLDTN